jgi:pyruvate kinase
MRVLSRTKMIATLGPSSADTATLKKMIASGVDLVRINYSHGEHDEHLLLIQAARLAAKQNHTEIGIIADLQGPKVRTGLFEKGLIKLKENDLFILDCDKTTPGDNDSVGVDYTTLYQDVAAGDVLLLDDGLIELVIESIQNKKIHCKVKTPGVLSNNKGINKLGGGLSANALTEKDFIDINAALKAKVDYIAVSFARNANDIEIAKQKIQKANAKAGVIAKIERAEALEHIDDIINAADAVMVARGDLGVEIGLAEVPFQQRRIIHRARALNKAVITATQMMESMIEHPKPTRAEVSDVANAIIEGTDAVMFSAETAVGNHPVKVIATARDIALSAEKRPTTRTSQHRIHEQFQRVDETIAMATMYAANHYPIKAIIALTESGKTPLWMSRIRSSIPIYALTRALETHRKMTLFRGVFPLAFDPTCHPEDKLEKAIFDLMKEKKCLKKGDQIILTRGSHLGDKGHTNSLKILTLS